MEKIHSFTFHANKLEWNETMLRLKPSLLRLFLCLQRLQTKVIKIVDVSYGGENGFNQAIELASDALANVKFIQEKKLIGKSVVFGRRN